MRMCFEGNTGFTAIADGKSNALYIYGYSYIEGQWKICVITCTPNNNFEVLRNHEMFNWFMEFNKYQIYGSRQYPKKNCHWITMEVQSHNIITCYMLKLMLKCVMPMNVICV